MTKQSILLKQRKRATWAVLCAALLFALPLYAQETAPESLPLRRESTPFSIMLNPPPKGTDISSAAKSPFFPAALIDQLQPIIRTQAAEVRILSRWATEVLGTIEAMVWFWERNELDKCLTHLMRVEQQTIELATYRKSWMPKAAQESGPDHWIPTAVALEELQLALERRAILWRQALIVETGPSHPVTKHFTKGAAELQRLTSMTLDVEAFFLDERTKSASGEQIGSLWCDYLDTKAFVAELEACQKSILKPNRRVSTLVSTIPIPMLVSFSDRANVILDRLDERNLAKSQIEYLRSPVIVAWKEELEQWSADTVSPRTLLREMEAYETHCGMSDMERLFRLSVRLSFSKTENYRTLGMMAQDVYGGSNVKIYISKVLVNHLLPPTETEVASFREVIQGQPVVGRRQADLDIAMNFHPDPERLLLSLDLKGSISTQSQASAFATTLFNRGQADCSARKRIELTEEGFLLSPTDVSVEKNRLQLKNFQTDFDGIPLLSGLVRNAVRNQYEARQGSAREETRRKIVKQIKDRVDKEADGRFKEFNEKFRRFTETTMTEFDLFLEKKNAATEEHWLLTSWAIRSQNSLSGNTPAPETLPGTFADLKIHESALNTILGKLDIDGRSATVGEFKQMLAERFHRPEIAEPGENDDVEIAFAAYNPVTVRFTDGRIELAISIDSLKIQGATHRNFKVFVRYRPVETKDGRLVLERDPVLSLANVRAQIVLRAVFGKIFPANRPIPLTPKFLENDPRFESLSTGCCRIEKGWFAIALVSKDSSGGQPLVSDKTPVRQAIR